MRVSDNATDAQLAFDSNPVGIGFDYKLQSRIYAFASNNTLYTFSSLEYGFEQSHIATNTGIYVEKIFVNSAPFVFQGRENTAVYAIMDLNCTVKIDLPEGKTADRIVQVVTSGYDMIFLFEDGSVYYMQVEGFTTDGECIHSQLVYAEALTRLYQEGKIKQILSVTGYYRFCVAMDDNLTYQITADYWNSLI